MKQLIKAAIDNNTSFWVCLSIAIVLLLGGALTPPLFIIDKSIFIGVGELWAFGALGAFIKALDKGKNASIKKGNTEITIGNDEDK